MSVPVGVLENVLKFLERVSVTGRECYAWCEAHATLAEEIKLRRAAQIRPDATTNGDAQTLVHPPPETQVR